MTKSFYLIAIWLALGGCDRSVQSDSKPSGQSGITSLPYIADKGRRLPYIRYVTSGGDAGSGKVFFLYPMMNRRNELLVLDYSVAEDISGLFAEDMIGTTGPVVLDSGTLTAEFLPMSLPIGMASGREWSLRYAKQDFTCRSAQSPESRDTLVITCISSKHTLTFQFSKARGVLSYQDFCGSAICTYKLIEQEGLLSRAVLKHMGLPEV